MTKEEAIHILENLKPTNTNSSFDAYVVGEALTMAISALSENKGDLISRQAVEEIIDDIRGYISVEGYWAILERMKKLPSAESKCFDGMTNGEVIQVLFPYVKIEDTSFDTLIGTDLDKGYIPFQRDWWDAPYKAKSEER